MYDDHEWQVFYFPNLSFQVARTQILNAIQEAQELGFESEALELRSMIDLGF